MISLIVLAVFIVLVLTTKISHSRITFIFASFLGVWVWGETWYRANYISA